MASAIAPATLARMLAALELARLQFAITTIYHFLFVPVSIGMALFVAICQTLHHRTGREVYDRMARYWGRLFVIVFALGVLVSNARVLLVDEPTTHLEPSAAQALLVRLTALRDRTARASWRSSTARAT